jgi:shikimate dehydrogenase
MDQITRVGLLGWPVGHSVSPAMHNAAFAARGLNWQYTAHAVPPDQLETEIARLIHEEGYRGFNVTIPHKQAVLRLGMVTDISPAAQAIGAANLLIAGPDGTLKADNTDWKGFTSDLSMYRVPIEDAVALLLGSGGSARAVAYALRQGNAGAVTLISREPGAREDVAGYGDLPRLAPGATLIVNCTPLGMLPEVDRTPWPADVPFPPGAALYDLVYNPPVTRLMQQARAAGAKVIGGLGMLVWQGGFAFEAWTGSPPPVDLMFAAAKSALNKAG